MNDNTKRMPETPGVYADRDGRLWVFLESFDGQLLGMDISTALELYCEEKIKLDTKHVYQLFAPFTKLERLDTVDTDKEKTETKNMKNNTSLTEDTASVGHAYPQGQVIIRCGECNSTIYRGAIDFVQLVKNWNKEAE